MKELTQMNIQDYVEVALRRKWLIILPLVLIFIGGIIYSYRLSSIYRASTLILVQQQRIPPAYIQATVTSPVGERLHTISQQIMSRTRLEKIINELNLYKDLRESLFMEELIEKMRKDITLEVRGNTSFQLYYQGKNPKQVASVCNKLASLFIEENLKVRELQAEGTTEFLDRELIRVKKRLEEQETALRKFKEKYMGTLPEQLDANLRSLDRLQLQYQALTNSLESAQERKILLQKQISQFSEMRSQIITDDVEINEGDNGEFGMAGSPHLEQLRQMLANLETRYTEKHPDVVRIKNQIKKLEAEAGSGGGEEGLDDTSLLGPDSGFDFTETLRIQLQEIDMEIKKLKEGQKEITARIAQYQKRVEEIPKREQQLLSIKRNYANTQKNYQSLLDKKLNAQLAANMERTQKGERFKVLDAARSPQKPFKPNRQRIILLALLLGLGVGGGLAFGAEYLDHSFRDIDELEKFTGLPVLAYVPRISTDEDLRRKKIKKRIIFASSFGILAIVIAIVYFFIFPV